MSNPQQISTFSKYATNMTFPEGFGDENFEQLLGETPAFMDTFEGKVVRGVVVDVERDFIVVDVGLKSEGRVSKREFAVNGLEPEIKAGDQVEVYVERFEDSKGEPVLSRERARREEAWSILENAHTREERVTGTIFGRVKGGFTVDLNGAIAFLPASQVDIRPVKDVGPLMNESQPFLILKMDKARGNIVVSRRAVMEESRAEAKGELISKMKEGMILKGMVKNITDYGAFIDLGGVDGLLHVTDISWKRINHPSDALEVGQTVEVQVVRFNRDSQRISLGMKQLESDPWEGVANRYPVNAKFKGHITNITDYGAFVELEAGVEGLIHVSEMSWTRKNVSPGQLVSASEEVEIIILDIDEEKRRISLGLKQCINNPWDDFAEKNKVDAVLDVEVRNITEFGLFVAVSEELEGLVHISDLSWDNGEEAIKSYSKGDKLKVKILEIDVEKERIGLGVKQLSEAPAEKAMDGLAKGTIVTGTVTEITENGIEVQISEGVTGFIKRNDLSKDRSEQRPDRFAKGEKVDAKIVSVEKNSRKLNLSIKAMEAEEERKAMEEFGSSDSGASLGDILGAAMNKQSSGNSDS